MDVGIKVIFAGATGAGKTTAVSAIAADLGLDLVRIDLSKEVNKYVGETEKNLEKIFDAVEESDAILYFDEADALFGKRSDIKDAHDRYSNTEIAYLLQRMEEYKGLVILATNLRQNIDHAFLRRMNFVVQFPIQDDKRDIHELKSRLSTLLRNGLASHEENS